jgi:ATP-dependent RNA helicase DeaD
MDQPQRDRVMGRLRDGTAELLVATDVAARGLDVDTLTHVVNYDVPSAPESYVHRIGRVGRAGRHGVAITLAEPREQRLLFNIEKLTKQKIAIERVPTVADLRARQIEQTVNAVREALAADDLDDYNEVLNALSGEHNLRTIALAAVKLAHEASGATVDEAEIPDFSHKVERGPRSEKPARDARPGHRGQRPAPGPRGGGSPGTAFIYVALGRKVGIRAGDLVGLIANESNLSGREIGPIKLTEQYSIVGVPESRVDDVIESLKGTLLKGKRPNARRYTE